MTLSPPQPQSPPPCPITGDIDVSLVAEIPTEDIRRIWHRDLGIDVTPNFRGVGRLRLWHAHGSDLQFFDPPCPGGRPLYDALRAKSWYTQDDKWEFWETAKWVPPGADVLELGAGTGAFREYIPEATYHGVDAFPIGRHIKSAIAAEEQFHVVCAFQVLEHVPDPKGFVARAAEYLKPGGQMFLGVPNRNSYLALFPTFPLELPPHHVTRWSDAALRSLVETIGLKVELVRQAPLEPWERALFHMARLESTLVRQSGRLQWRHGWPQQLGRVASYLGGSALGRLAIPPDASGSTLLIRMRKI